MASAAKIDPWAKSVYMCPVLNPHDVGGDEDQYTKLDLTERSYEHWERAVHGLMVLLVGKKMLTVDEMRRGIEALPPAIYDTWGYYEKWAISIASILIERGIFTQFAWDAALGKGGTSLSDSPLFTPSQHVTVLSEQQPVTPLTKKPHLRTPGYVHGCTGVIERYCGVFADPSVLAFRGNQQMQHLYRVRFNQSDLWPTAALDTTTPVIGNAGTAGTADTVDVEIFQDWLIASTCTSMADSRTHDHSHDHSHSHEHHEHVGIGKSSSITATESSHTHDHGHVHEDRFTVEQNAVTKEGEETLGMQISRILVLETQRLGLVSADEITQAIEKVDSLGAHSEGPRIVARCWVDSSFKNIMLSDANAALSQLGIQGSNGTAATKLTALQNTSDVHNIVVCTLCSCYPLSILGLSPPWYKSRSYRARMVRQPRIVLAEFGTVVPAEVAIRVHDSTADLRYIVIPERPAGTEGWDEEKLQTLVTRDSMIGVRRAIIPVNV